MTQFLGSEDTRALALVSRTDQTTVRSLWESSALFFSRRPAFALMQALRGNEDGDGADGDATNPVHKAYAWSHAYMYLRSRLESSECPLLQFGCNGDSQHIGNGFSQVSIFAQYGFSGLPLRFCVTLDALNLPIIRNMSWFPCASFALDFKAWCPCPRPLPITPERDLSVCQLAPLLLKMLMHHGYQDTHFVYVHSVTHAEWIIDIWFGLGVTTVLLHLECQNAEVLTQIRTGHLYQRWEAHIHVR
jgi:hypothetical protein